MIDFMYATMGVLFFSFSALMILGGVTAVVCAYHQFKYEQDLELENEIWDLKKELRTVKQQKKEWEVACDKLYDENEGLRNAKKESSDL